MSAWQAFEKHCGAEPEAEERIFSVNCAVREGGREGKLIRVMKSLTSDA